MSLVPFNGPKKSIDFIMSLHIYSTGTLIVKCPCAVMWREIMSLVPLNGPKKSKAPLKVKICAGTI
jgi:hypothetical protein